MSFRYLLNISALLVVPVVYCGLGAAALAAGNSSVQTYADQVAPLPAQADLPPQGFYDSPLTAGTLTLEDVLSAHKPPEAPSLPAPVLNGGGVPTTTAPLLAPAQSSSTGLMMSQGMKAVLQKVGVSNGAPVTVRPPVGEAGVAQGAPAQLVPIVGPPSGGPTTIGGVTYEPGQAPKNLATGAPAADATAMAGAIPPAATPVSTSAPAPSAADIAAAAPDQSCDQHVQKWDKTCAEAGYPATYVGKIVGETRTGCADNALHDVWVTNTCAPADNSATTAKTDGACGVASDNEFDDAPNANLCAQGIASAVSGSGPWTWACSGINGGDAAACAAPRRVSPVNGVCGSANGVAVSSPPSDDLCNEGNATAVKGSGPWTWTCKGIGKGNSESCIAPASGGHHEAAPVATPTPSAAETSPGAPIASPAASSNEKGELCGAAAETLAYEAPDKDLCRVGNASAVNGDGPWTWSCTTNEGLTSSCRTLSLSGDAAAPAAPKAAPEAAVSSGETSAPAPQAAAASTPPPEDNPFSHPSAPLAASMPTLACGVAASAPAASAPASDLCQGGKASAVRGSGPWHWSCSKGHAKVACETPHMLDASCGAANGSSLQSAPFAGLCAAGTPSSIQGNGPWTWTCNGSGGGVSVSCAAAQQGAKADSGKIDGACGSIDGANVNQAPTADLCAGGSASAVSGSGPWTWSCSGTNGGAVTTCAAGKITPPKPPGIAVNGLCGEANGSMSSARPVDELCANGDASSVVGNGPWNWSCIGKNGGMTVSCTAPMEPPAPIDGECGSAGGVPTLTKPVSGLCASGITGSVNGHGPWTWTCSGANGGNPASCIAPTAGKVGAMPSTMTPAIETAAAPDALAPPPVPSGLVTPHLASSDGVPSLDKKALPSLVPSKAFGSKPAPSPVPTPPTIGGDDVDGDIPTLPAGSEPVTPPALHDNLPSAAVLNEKMQAEAAIPGNHLALDPTLSTVVFSRGSGNIDEQVLTTLDRLAAVLQANGDVRISLIAYADNTGSTPRDARRLSLTRALAVRDYLSSKGISESRIDVHAEGANTTSGYIDRVDVKVND